MTPPTLPVYHFNIRSQLNRFGGNQQLTVRYSPAAPAAAAAPVEEEAPPAGKKSRAYLSMPAHSPLTKT